MGTAAPPQLHCISRLSGALYLVVFILAAVCIAEGGAGGRLCHDQCPLGSTGEWGQRLSQ